MSNKEILLWKKNTLTIEGKEFYVSEEPTGVVARLLEFMIEPDLINKIDELFSPNGQGYPYGDKDEETFACEGIDRWRGYTMATKL